MKLQIMLDKQTAVQLMRAAVEDRRSVSMQAEVELARALGDRAAKQEADHVAG
jgi:hypothetical protein